MDVYLVIIILAQVLAFCIQAYAFSLEKKYCGHCDWWLDAGAIIFLVIDLIPIIGLFTSIAGCTDCIRNVADELSKSKHTKAKY